MRTFRNALFHLQRQVGTCLWRWNRVSETSAYKIQRPRKYPEETIQQKRISFTFHYISECFTLVLKSEEVHFQLLYIAVTLNVVIYFHSCVLYIRYIVGLLSCISNGIGVLTCGQDDEKLHFPLWRSHGFTIETSAPVC